MHSKLSNIVKRNQFIQVKNTRDQRCKASLTMKQVMILEANRVATVKTRNDEVLNIYCNLLAK